MKKTFMILGILSVLIYTKSRIYAQPNSFNNVPINERGIDSYTNLIFNTSLFSNLFHSNEWLFRDFSESKILPNRTSMLNLTPSKNWTITISELDNNQRIKNLITPKNTKETLSESLEITNWIPANSSSKKKAMDTNNNRLKQTKTLLPIGFIWLISNYTSASCTPPNCNPLWNGNN